MTEPLKFEFTNECTCKSYDEDTDTYSPSYDCFGDCFTQQSEDLEEVVLKPWREALGEDTLDEARIDAVGMGWKKVSGWTTTSPDINGVLKALSINGHYRLVFILDGDNLTANRYSHDEPTGSAVFTFSKES